VEETRTLDNMSSDLFMRAVAHHHALFPSRIRKMEQAVHSCADSRPQLALIVVSMPEIAAGRNQLIPLLHLHREVAREFKKILMRFYRQVSERWESKRAKS
jgi:hypothetical protein